MKRLAGEGRRAATGQGKKGRSREDGSAHDQHERGVPAAGDVEEGEDLARIGQPREQQADPEEQADEEAAEQIERPGHQDTSPSTCRSTNTVAKPAAMKQEVATSEGNDQRDRPQTP